MGFRTLGRVVAKWIAVPVPLDADWGMPAPAVPDAAARFYLEVAVVHPQTEQAQCRIVQCADRAQWDRYQVGGWMRLRLRDAVPFLGARGLGMIEE